MAMGHNLKSVAACCADQFGTGKGALLKSKKMTFASKDRKCQPGWFGQPHDLDTLVRPPLFCDIMHSNNWNNAWIKCTNFGS
jgi:hypothetical protein